MNWTSVKDNVVEFVAPAPLSPVFLPGGALAGWNEDLTLTGAAMLALVVLDVALVQRYLINARYFALHAFINAIVVVAAFPDAAKVFMTGHEAMVGPSYTMVANSAIAAIHIYHCVAFQLSFADIMHHAVFVTVLCGLAVPFKHVGGALNNFGCFFLSGLPGGIDYVLLVLVKQGKIDKLTEKRWNARIQSWLRAPPMAIYAFCAFQLYLFKRDAMAFHGAVLFVVSALHILNGVYYTAQAVETWARHDTLAQQERTTAKKK
jgi:hypothetical protein